MKKKILALIIVLAVTVSVLALGRSLGWFISGGGGDPYKAQTIEYGDMEFSLVGGCDIHPAYIDEVESKEYAAPGENMIYVESSTPGVLIPGSLKVLNKSTITTNLRVKIVYSWWNTTTTALEPVFYGDRTDDFEVKNASGMPLGTPGDGWTYDSSTKCWNYLPGGNAIPAVANPAAGEEITLLSSLGYSSAMEDARLLIYKNLNVTVKFKVEAKQADYVNWSVVSPPA